MAGSVIFLNDHCFLIYVCRSHSGILHAVIAIALVVHVVAILIRLVVWVGVDCTCGIIKELYSVCAHSGMCQLSAWGGSDAVGAVREV